MTTEEFGASQIGIIGVTGIRKEKLSFTKTVMVIVMLLYFIGALLGGILVVSAAVVDVGLGLQIDSQMFVAYAVYLGSPTATAIAFYAWKSKAENLLKIQNTNELAQKNNTVTTTYSPSNLDISVLANMGGNT